MIRALSFGALLVGALLAGAIGAPHAQQLLCGGSGSNNGTGIVFGPCPVNQQANTFFFAANGSDTNNGTSSATPWKTTAPLHALTGLVNATLMVNAGDTITGCYKADWTSNVSGTFQQMTYGNQALGHGKFAADSTCPNTSRTAILLINSPQGNFTSTNIDFVGNSGGTPIGVMIENTNTVTLAPGTVTIGNFETTNFWDAASNNYGGHVFYSGWPGAGVQSVVLHDWKCHGTTGVASTEDSCLNGFGTPNDATNLQNLEVYNFAGWNIGGRASVAAQSGSCLQPNAVVNAYLHNAVCHDIANNTVQAGLTGCGNAYGFWGARIHNLRMSWLEVYNVHSSVVGGCDKGAIDFDQEIINGTFDHIYGHNTDGEGVLIYDTGNHHITGWDSLFLNTGQVNGGSFQWQFTSSSSEAHIYNSIFSGPGIPLNTGATCPLSSNFENLVLEDTAPANGLTWVAYIANGGSTCASEVFDHNGYLVTGNPLFREGGNIYQSLAAWQAGHPGGDVGSFLTPTAGWAGGNDLHGPTSVPTCTSETTAPPSETTFGSCLSGFKLVSGSPLMSAGVAPTGVPAGVTIPAQDFNGVALPPYPIGPFVGPVQGGSLHLDFTGGVLPAGTTFAGGAGTSYYDASKVLHPNNPAGHPRFDHDPSTGASLGIDLEQVNGNYWAATNAAPSNTSAADNDHAEIFPLLGNPQTTIAWGGVWGIMHANAATGPDNVANSAGVFTEDSCTFLTSGSPAAPGASPNFCTGDNTPNAGDGGHASTNTILPGLDGPNKFALTSGTVVVSGFVARNTDANDAGRNVTMFSDGVGGSCAMTIDMGSGATITPLGPINGSGWTCSNPFVQAINIAGNPYWRMGFSMGINGTIGRVNFSLVQCCGTNVVNYTGDGHSGIKVYGVQITPAATTSIANSLIVNPNTYTAPVFTTADQLTITQIPSGIGHIVLKHDDNSTETLPVTAGQPYTINPAQLARPYVLTIDGTA